jgi:lipoprotein NlpI
MLSLSGMIDTCIGGRHASYIVRMLLGQLTPAAVLAAAEDPDAEIKSEKVCEANFYGGELTLQQARKDEATRLFRGAVAHCPKALIEWSAANAELNALGVKP